MIPDATVFVVDDDPEALRAMRWLLQAEGLAIEMYSSGEEFLRAYDPRISLTAPAFGNRSTCGNASPPGLPQATAPS